MVDRIIHELQIVNKREKEHKVFPLTNSIVTSKINYSFSKTIHKYFFPEKKKELINKLKVGMKFNINYEAVIFSKRPNLLSASLEL